MYKKLNRGISWALSVALCMASIPAPAFADVSDFTIVPLEDENVGLPVVQFVEEEPDLEETVPEGEMVLVEEQVAYEEPAAEPIEEPTEVPVEETGIALEAESESLVTDTQSSSKTSLATWKRLAGPSRYQTMSAITTEGFTSSSWAVVASGANYPDALVAASLAGAYECPILITGKDALSADAQSQLLRLGVRNVYLMGGTAAVSDAVETSIANLGIDTYRVAGNNRFLTSVLAMDAVKEAQVSSNTVVLASGFGFADALSISPWAYATHSPILLVGDDGTLSEEEVEAITSTSGIKRIVMVGGDSVISDDIKDQLGSSYTYVRLAGEDRYETNKDVMEWTCANGLSWKRPALTSGTQYPDALVGAALCGINKSPLALNSDTTLAMLMVHNAQISVAYILGGDAAVRSISSVTASGTLDGVDISGWNKGVDAAALEGDFTIIKATEGTQGTIYNPDYTDMAEDALSSGKVIGFYHYANGEDPIAEAESFYQAIKDYKGRAIACLDWEGQGNELFDTGFDVGWCRQFLDHLQELYGGTPFLYTSKNYVNKYDWTSVACRYPLWGAEYAYADRDTVGYEPDPWQSSASWGAWGGIPTVHQYSSLGVYQSELDSLGDDAYSYVEVDPDPEPEPEPDEDPNVAANEGEGQDDNEESTTSKGEDEKPKQLVRSLISNAHHFDFNKFYGTRALWQLFQK